MGPKINGSSVADLVAAAVDRQMEHSVLIKPATLEVRHFLNLTSRTVLLFFLVLYVIVEQPAVLILWICSLLIPP